MHDKEFERHCIKCLSTLFFLTAVPHVLHVKNTIFSSTQRLKHVEDKIINKTMCVKCVQALNTLKDNSSDIFPFNAIIVNVMLFSIQKRPSYPENNQIIGSSHNPIFRTTGFFRQPDFSDNRIFQTTGFSR